MVNEYAIALQVTELQTAMRLLPADRKTVRISEMRKARLISLMCNALLLTWQR